jgi:hypothetical protein
MNSNSRCFFIILATIFSSFSFTFCGGRQPMAGSKIQSAAQPIGQYRGHAEVNRSLKSALLDPADAASVDFDFSSFAIRGGLIEGQGLQSLLGMWTPGGLFGGGDSVYSNGAPTAMSAFLYETMMANLSERLGLACTENQLTFLPSDDGQFRPKYLLSQDFLRSARAFCTAADEADGRAASRNLWHLLIGYEFDESFDTLFDLLMLVPDYWAYTAEQRLQLLLHTLLLHPVFLLTY